MDTNTILLKIAIAAIPLVFAITVHEAAHGWVANKFGDHTAKNLGRITLNPLKHIDLVGTIILPIAMLFMSNFIFGYAKPVPVNWNNLRKPRRDMAFVAIAGPGANLLMALVWAGIARLTYTGSPNFFHLMAIFGIHINVLLLVLNLIPIPPLDGSRVVASFLPRRAALIYNSIEQYGIWILLLLLISGTLAMVLLPPARHIIAALQSLFGLPTRL
ncbi:MAG: site-2 protease family protein [Coxiella sp. (in: Bacteria)]|nr:MAG: site-2 protease family protein [Coxiella sp. (in: g-proteobacteria)]